MKLNEMDYERSEMDYDLDESTIFLFFILLLKTLRLVSQIHLLIRLNHGPFHSFDNQVFEKLNSMEEKIEKYRPKTPQEKLELRSLDSGPFHQKLSDFFQDKQDDMEKAGKNEYVLTSDEVEQIVPSDIKKSFDNYGVEPTQTSFKMG